MCLGKASVKGLLKHIATPGEEVNQMLTDVRRDVVQATDNQQVPWASTSPTTSFYFVSTQPSPLVANTAEPAAPKQKPVSSPPVNSWLSQLQT